MKDNVFQKKFCLCLMLCASQFSQVLILVSGCVFLEFVQYFFQLQIHKCGSKDAFSVNVNNGLCHRYSQQVTLWIGNFFPYDTFRT